MADKGILDTIDINKKIVVGLDFGTNGTGFSFSFRADSRKTIHNFQDWDECDHRYCKTLSGVLYDRDHNVLSWGYPAQREYLAQDDDDSNKNVLFKYFKLHFQNNPKGSFVQEGFEQPTHIIMEEYLYKVRELIMSVVTKFDPSIEQKDIRWCFTVPVVWEEHHKKEFRKIAVNALYIEEENCPENDFMIVTEAEAAAVYCIDNEKAKGDIDLQPGDTIMIVDAGGGTVDITVHKLDDLNRLKTVSIPSGNMYGSTSLDDGFLKVLKDHIGERTVDDFKTENPLLFSDIMSSWEKAKRGANDIKKSLKLNLPPKFVKVTKFSSIVDDETGKLSPTMVEQIFKIPIDKTIQLVKQQLETARYALKKHVNYIFLVGGFGQNEIFRKMLRECETKHTKIIMPKFSGEAVVNGAAMIGRDPSFIQTRRARYTYGVGVNQFFNPSIHERSRCSEKMIGVEKLVEGVFKKFVKSGQEVATDKVEEHTFDLSPYQTEANVTIYFTEKMDVKYVDESGVALITTISITVNPRPVKQSLIVVMKFGKAEILVEVKGPGGLVKSDQVKFSFDSLTF